MPPADVAIDIVPAPLVTAIPVPEEIVASTGSAPLDPIGSCPSVATPRGVTAPVPLPSKIP